MKIAIGADHAGYEMKEQFKQELTAAGHEVDDFGTHQPGETDYPEIALAVARAVAHGACERGVMICGTGIGSQIAANKVHGIRACVCGECFSARASRAHNDANVLCLGARVVGLGLAKDVLKAWLAEPFSGEERHRRRLARIAAAEDE